jgi:hypothetical protein
VIIAAVSAVSRKRSRRGRFQGRRFGDLEAAAAFPVILLVKLGDFCADNDIERVPKWIHP